MKLYSLLYADYELLRALVGPGNDSLAKKNLKETFLADLVKYNETSYSILKGAHTHDCEKFNSMKQAVLSALSK